MGFPRRTLSVPQVCSIRGDQHFAISHGIEAEETSQRLGAPGSNQSGQPENLTASQFQSHITGRPFTGKALERQHHCARCVSDSGKEVRYATADHQRDDLRVGRSRQLALSDGTAIAQHRVTVADLPDLFEEVADVDNPQPGVAQFANDCEEVIDILARERAGWLIEHDDLRFGDQGPRDLDQLLHGNRQVTDARLGPEMRMAEQIESLPHANSLRRAIDRNERSQPA